jgi:class 3 adenylate cyclase
VATCAECGYQAAASFRFCPECGVRADGQGREQRKVVTVLFCDVVGSTALGESTDPEAVRTLLARYFELQRHVALIEEKALPPGPFGVAGAGFEPATSGL